MLAFRRSRLPPSLLRPVAILLVAFSAVGCGRSNRYIPATTSAREALEAALTAWQNGQPVGKIDCATPIQAVDSGWGKGQKLVRYEILDEVPRTDGKRCFKVRLHLDQPQDTQEVHYLIVGRSPLWVFREEDYNRAQSWEG